MSVDTATAMPGRWVLVVAALLGLTGVALGAAASHSLGHLSEGALLSFRTGVRYQLFHALALLGIGVLLNQYPGNRGLRFAAGVMTLGCVLFSGSLYFFTHIAAAGMVWLAPVGGMLLLLGWMILLGAVFFYKTNNNNELQ